MVTTRGAGITAAAGTCLTHHLFAKLTNGQTSFGRPTNFGLGKSFLKKRKHSEFLRHTCVHCEISAPAASRRTWILVSESISELPLSRLVQIIGLSGRYPGNNLIRRSPILERGLLIRGHSSTPCLSGVSLSFPRLSQTRGNVNYVLLSFPPRRPELNTGTCMA